MPLDVARLTWQEIVPSILGGAYEVGLKFAFIGYVVLCAAEGELVGLWEEGVVDAAEKLINFV